MKKTFIGVLFAAILIFSSFSIPSYLLPTDILNTIPSFSKNFYIRPNNSLISDPLFQFEPWRKYAKERIGKGEFPLWNNLNSKGTPFFANPQTAVLFPLNFIYYLFPIKSSLFLIHILKLFLIGLFAFFYLRSLRCTFFVSLLGGIITSFLGFSIVWLQWPHTNVFLFFPLLLFLTEKIRQKNADYRWYLLIGVCYFLAILGGHPETLFHIVIIHTMYTIYRLWGNVKNIVLVFLNIFLGFLLGSIQLIPFIEYLLNSYSFAQRTSEEFYLPLVGFLVNILPFLFGAPHLQFYKPLYASNFQEMIGGYVSFPILIGAIAGIVYFKKIRNIRFWLLLVIIIEMIVYRIWPVWYITMLPLINIAANHRLIGFAGFGIIVISCLFLEFLLKYKKPTIFEKKMFYKLVSIFFFASIIIYFLFLKVVQYIVLPKKISLFSSFLLGDIFFIGISTLISLLLIALIRKNAHAYLKFLLLFFIVTQSIVVFWNYNTFSREYYPQNQFTRKLQLLPAGTVLEVGNPSLPPNLNMMYDLEQSQYYDALETSEYKKQFNTSFPIKNQWGNVENINRETVTKFGINYIISDFDVNLRREKIQNARTKILPALTAQNPIQVSFVSNSNSILKQVRILTANFNRLNTCVLIIKLIGETQQQTIDTTSIPCKDVKDNMYQSITFKNSKLKKGDRYIFSVNSKDATAGNSIALWGNNEEEPYIELLFKTNSKNIYPLLYQGKNLSIWEVPDVSDIEYNGAYKIINNSPENITLELTSKNGQSLKLKRTYFPGWIARIDGKEVVMNNTRPFMSIFIPKGHHMLEIVYRPLSLVTGIVVSFTTFLFIFLFVLRKEMKDMHGRYEKVWKGFAQKINKSMSWKDHVIIFFFAISFSLVSFYFITYLVPIHFKLPETSAINWLTVNDYPKQKDYFYFYTGFSYVLIASIIIWFLWIWRKIK